MAYCSSYSSGGMFQGTVRAVYVANIYTSTSTVEQKYLSSSYTFNKNTGAFTLTSPSLSAYSTSSVGKYTCDSSTSSTCNKMYKIVKTMKGVEFMGNIRKLDDNVNIVRH